MAERGGQAGNQNAAKGRQWRDAINRALMHWPDKPMCLESNRGISEAAYAFVEKLMAEKDIQFFKELGDRVDGKAQQAMTLDGEIEAGAGLLGILANMKADK